MISLDQALAHYCQLRPLADSLSVPLDQAHGRTLSRPLHSLIDLPPMRQSAMDGYAVQRADLAQATAQHGIKLALTQEVAAGSSAKALSSGQCARIFTGAPIPAGADAVEIQENVDNNAHSIVFHQTVSAGQHIREQGEEIAAGQQVLPQGQRLDAQSLSIAANAGHAYLPCRPRLRVAVIVTGNELVAPGSPRSGAQVFESNGQFLRHFVSEMDAQLSHISHCHDDRDALSAQVRQALNQADILLISGGASVGDHDHSRAAASDARVSEVFWKVAQKPGKPLSYGLSAKQQPVFILPGNPGSVYVGAMVHVRAAILSLSGRSALPSVSLSSTQAIKADAGRERLVRASLQLQQGRLIATPLPRQASHMSSNLATTQAILRIPAGQDINRGARLQAWLCRPL